MTYAWWRCGRHRDEAVFHLFFRKNPFDGGYAIAAGLEEAIRYLDSLRFEADDLEYLATLRGNDGAALFPDDFLRWLGDFRFSCDVDAIPEGTVAFAHEPLLRIRGPLPQAAIVETALLNILNFQTLLATKAARVVHAAGGDPVVDFGLRRAQGADGALSAARAAYIGGIAGTSNVLAGARYGMPVRGTHAHSWVMSFDDEQEAFDAYAGALPNNTLLLVDTYDTLEGVAHAIETAKRLRERGHAFVGIRLDSGDLAYLSIEARRMLREAGFADAVIAASNDLDEDVITSLKTQNAEVTLWGVGTRLITAWDQPALGGVYKLAAMRREGEERWQHRIKLSEQLVKVSTPGMLQVRRFEAGDMIWDELTGANTSTIVDPLDLTRRRKLEGEGVDLLVPVFRDGQLVYDPPSLDAIRAHRERDLARFHDSIKRIVNPHDHPVGLEQTLHELKTRLVLEARGAAA
ncbi:MAG: nicotinate phosphoribosyltransferase [Acidobacteriota bacterium]|nr:nicotinate phosphoribosyltransferase [Acidobacteriota bacterium]